MPDIDKQKLRELCERADDCSLNLVEWNELSSSVPDLLDRIDELEEKFEAADAVAGDNDAALVEVTNENRRLRAQLESQIRGVDEGMVERAARKLCEMDDTDPEYLCHCDDGMDGSRYDCDKLAWKAWENEARAALEAALAVPAQQWRSISEAQIKHMVDRFLQWRLPNNFDPDAGISYRRPNYAPEVDASPSGTNLLDAAQATDMVRFMVEGLPFPVPPAQDGK